MKKKILCSAIICLLLITGCGKIPKLANGEEAVAEIEGKKFSAEELYQKMKGTYGTNALVNMIDAYIADKEFETDDDAKSYAKNELATIKSQYEMYGMDFKAALEQAGYESEDKLLDEIITEYKKDKVLKNYLKENIDEEEAKKYYDENVFGEMTVRHILITPDTNSEMSEEDKKNAEEDALNRAKDIINKLNDGANFEDLAKEYSKDTGSASEGGLIKDFTKETVVAEFWNASYDLKDGEYTSEPVKSSYGYHIILKVSQNEKPSYDDSKDDILGKLAEEKLNNDSTLSAKTWNDIRKKKYKLNIVDSDINKKYDETVESLTK